jgi:uncharacterized membrane-anchored protein YitT (DUF2179 family)
MTGIFNIRKLGKFETYFFLTLGVFLMACAYYFFVIPSGLVTGGATGLAIIASRYFHSVPISVFSLGFNVTFLILGAIFLGKKELGKTIFGSLLFPAFLALFELLVPDPIFADRDLLLVTIFAGGFAGMGFGIVCKYGGSTGGSDIAIKIVKKYTKLSLSTSIYMVEAAIIIAGALTYPVAEGGINSGIINALYAIVVVFITGRVSDSYLIGSQSKKAVNIITDRPKEIKSVLFATLRRGITEIPSIGGYTDNKKTLLIMVIQNTEYHLVTQIITAQDPKAFVYVTPASEISGAWSSKEEVLLNRGESPKTVAK